MSGRSSKFRHFRIEDKSSGRGQSIITLEAAEASYRRGLLNPDSRITYEEASSGKLVTVEAQEVPFLSFLFQTRKLPPDLPASTANQPVAVDEPSAPENPLEARPMPDRASRSIEVVKNPGEEATNGAREEAAVIDLRAIETTQPEEARAPESTEVEITDPPTDGGLDDGLEPVQRTSAIPIPLLVVVGIFLAFLLVIFIAAGGNDRRYVLTDTTTYLQPDIVRNSSGNLLQGEELEVEEAGQDGWFKIVSGPLAGQFVPAGVLGEDRPLPIDRSAAATLRVQQALLLVEAPDPASPFVARLGPGEEIAILGKVNGAEADNWYQFEFRGSDGLLKPAYGRLSPDADMIRKNQSPASAPTPPSALGNDASAPHTQAAPAAPPVAPTPPASRNPCKQMRRPIDRLICQDPSLRQPQRQLAAAWQSANTRMARAGQSLAPMRAYLAPVERCRTPACARNAFADQIARLERTTPQLSQFETPAPNVFTPRAATPRNNPAGWITANDYPSRAMREEAEGTTAFQVTVGPNGRVTDCWITASSGSADLDAATCANVSRRARFNPATDTSGQPVAGTYSNRVRWVLPQ